VQIERVYDCEKRQKGAEMDLRWSEQAYQTAVAAGQASSAERRRWEGQNEWDAENMCTESTRFTVDRDEELRQCCREANITRYTLINYLLRTWMAAWKHYQGGGR